MGYIPIRISNGHQCSSFFVDYDVILHAFSYELGLARIHLTQNVDLAALAALVCTGFGGRRDNDFFSPGGPDDIWAGFKGLA
jgi:hypothetical protein